MFLKSITLRDWKAYGGENRFEFPLPTKRKNVVIIGASNGFGKTSLLEALLLGLYGKDGLRLVARANKPLEKEADKGYPAFLSRALHSRAISEGRSSMTVELEFEDAESETGSLTLSRTWYFKPGDGAFREEQVHVFTGRERRPLRAPRLEDDAEDFFRGYIARETLPSHLAQFFLFDGEQVQRLAQTDMASQVRIGIEGMLGATVLRTLAADLASYARDRRGKLRDVTSDGALERVRAELDVLEAQRDLLEKEDAALSEALGPLSRKREGLRSRLEGVQGGSFDNVKELQRKKTFIENALAMQKERLSLLLTNDFALAVVGRPLREKVRLRLQQERELAAWEGGIQNSARQLRRFTEEFEKAPPRFEPPLDDAQFAALQEKIKVAWQQMWHPPPEGCASYYRHSYLAEGDRLFVTERLTQLDALGQSGIQDLLHGISQNESDLRRLDGQISGFEAIGPALDKMVAELQAVMDEVSEKSARKAQLERELTGIRSQLQAKKADYQRLVSKYEAAQPELVRIKLAETISNMLPAFIEEGTGAWVSRIAEHMTEAYREIAHKGTIHRVEIDRDCQVSLLTKGGQDYRFLDASAGEDQVFSFALISAIARAAEVRFPIIIDTPLARLDRGHRLNILKHFTERAGNQIILLSQDTEVVGEYLEVVRDRVARTFLIEHRHIGEGVGQNRVLPDKYFERI